LIGGEGAEGRKDAHFSVQLKRVPKERSYTRGKKIKERGVYQKDRFLRRQTKGRNVELSDPIRKGKDFKLVGAASGGGRGRIRGTPCGKSKWEKASHHFFN